MKSLKKLIPIGLVTSCLSSCAGNGAFAKEVEARSVNYNAKVVADSVNLKKMPPL